MIEYIYDPRLIENFLIFVKLKRHFYDKSNTINVFFFIKLKTEHFCRHDVLPDTIKSCITD